MYYLSLNNMIRIYENRDIRALNSFGIKARARYWIDFDNHDELQNTLRDNRLSGLPLLLAGSGTNILFTGDFNGCVIHPVNDNIRIIKENNASVIIEAEAGLDWDTFVEWTVKNNYYGLENLSLIPGSAGAAVVQNIGAYGVELGD